jgi:hypothetical protein
MGAVIEREDLNPEVEVQTLLEAVTRKLLVNTLLAGEDLESEL